MSIYTIGMLFVLAEFYFMIAAEYQFAMDSYKYMFIPNIPENDDHSKEYWIQYKTDYVNSSMMIKIGMIAIQMFFGYLVDTTISINFSKLNSKVDDIKEELSDFKHETKTELSLIKTDISAIKLDIVNVKCDIKDLQTDVKSIKAEMVNMEDRIISKMQTEMVNMEDRMIAKMQMMFDQMRS
jgi:hypothetical protein